MAPMGGAAAVWHGFLSSGPDVLLGRWSQPPVFVVDVEVGRILQRMMGRDAAQWVATSLPQGALPSGRHYLTTSGRHGPCLWPLCKLWRGEAGLMTAGACVGPCPPCMQLQVTAAWEVFGTWPPVSTYGEVCVWLCAS